MLKLGSLFDGSGGFPLAGALCGIEPVWASEIEPYPIAVTKTRFPHMKHLGDISKVNGAEVEPVDIITFGSPCQDLSVAGKRAGLKHADNGDEETTRSGLFMEAVRIIKEMREKTNGEYPRYAVWENVPGAFSSNKGEDFKVVLEELVKITAPSAAMPDVPKFGWPYADSYCGDGWSLAYRVLDAQYWGVPQRRRRIYLVADFGGQRAREILFEREGLRGYFTQGGTPWKAAPTDAEGSLGADDRAGETPYTLKIRSGCEGGGKGALIQNNMSATLACNNDQYLFQPIADDAQAVAYGISSYESNAMKSKNPHSGIYKADTSRTLDLNGGNPACNQGGIAIVEPVAVATQQGGAEITDNGICPTITAAAGISGNNQPWICKVADDHILDDQGGSQISVRHDGKSPTLRAEMHGNVPCVLAAAAFCPEQSAKTRGIGYEEENSPTLRAGVTPAVVCCLDGDKIGKAERAGGSGLGIREGDKMYTLTAKDAKSHAMAYMFENHSQDTHHKDAPDVSVTLKPIGVDCFNLCTTGDIGRTVTTASGGLNEHIPVVMEPFCKSRRAKNSNDATTWKHGKAANTLNTFDQGEVRANELVVEGTPVLTSSKASHFMRTEEELASTLVASDYKDPQLVCHENNPIAIDRAFFNQGKNALYEPQTYEDGTVPTLVAKGPGAVAVRYIVRRLTPTECARLQGFADRWGDIEPKSKLSDDEYHFWLDVRKTYDAINGRADKDYTKKQILTWYNKLQTDSAEYKMWGNGIALPTALYVLQGVSDHLKGE